MYVIDVVQHPKKIAPRDGTLLGIKLKNNAGILAGQMVRRRFENDSGHPCTSIRHRVWEVMMRQSG